MRKMNAFDAGIIALGAALNVAIGYLVSLLKLPLYLDSIGTVLISVLCGWFYGVVTGLASLIILTVTVAPNVIAYAGTAVVIGILSAMLGRIGFLRKTRITIAGGILLGIAAAAASVPVTTLLYGGVSLAGSDAITALLRAYGLPIWKSVVLGSLFTDIFDKLLTAVIAMSLIRTLPPRLLGRLNGNSLTGADSSGALSPDDGQ